MNLVLPQCLADASMIPTGLTSWERFTVTFGPLFPLLTGALGAIVAAMIAAGVAWLTSKRHDEQMKAERVAAKKRDKAAWNRQRKSFNRQQAQERALFERSQTSDRAMFLARIEAEAAAEVRVRAVAHGEAILPVLGQLEELTAHPWERADQDSVEQKVREYFALMKLDVGYLDTELRDRFEIMFQTFDALEDRGQLPWREYYPFAVLRTLVVETRDNLFARFRGEELPDLTAMQSTIRQKYREMVELEERQMEIFLRGDSPSAT